MNITEAFVLKSDVLLIPCAELTPEVRERISFDDGDFTLSRRHGRAPSQVIDGETAGLLSLFRQPRTIVEVVVENSRSLGKDAEALLDELLPHLGVFLQNRVLVPAGAEEEQEIRPRFDSGSRVEGWEIGRCVSLVEDSEVYAVRDGDRAAALKIARDSQPFDDSLFGNEAAILGHLDGGATTPRLYASGSLDGRPYLVIEWIAGVESTVAAAQRRHDRPALLDLCASIAAAYAALHARGVLHSDVHPRNVLVGERGEVRLLDFGFSRRVDEPSRVGRGGMYYFFEPELLAVQRQHVSLPSSEAGEQYALAALLYLLIAGNHYLDFRYEREEMARQAESDPPLPFAQRGIPPWPDVERILFRALEKDPAKRYATVAELAAQLAEARDAAATEALTTPVSVETEAFLATTLRSFARGGDVFVSRYPTAPTASINNGAAGAAIGLLRIAEARSDAKLLALADVWRSRAAALVGSDDAYYNADLELSRDILGDVSPYHTEAGIHATAAMIAAAMGDTMAQHRATAAFLAASRRPCAALDLTLGRSGSLLAASLLLSSLDDPSLRAFGSETMTAIWRDLDAHPPLRDGLAETYLGLAHGWAGYLYAALRWCAASGDAPPPRLVERLHEYASMQTRRGRGTHWRRMADSPPFDVMAGWCNGSAGAVFLWTLAHRLLGDDEWLALAELAAWHAWDEPRGPGDLCCGAAGRAYAMLNLYKHTGATEWLSRARQLANHAAAVIAATAQRPHSLWKGELGVAVLIADLEAPESASMPFFE
ncbi:MAG TPA: lanthionine synthetase LanC family protein [Thermoanaerobaculia bacterium]|nr:lanthionine synthetase LanC family protein [Thermoanaerobaculia bacterium]